MNKKIVILVIFLFGVQSSNPLFASELTDDYFDIATNYFNSNNYAKSLEYLDAVLQAEPDNLQAQTLRNKVSPLIVDDLTAKNEIAKVFSSVSNPENLVILNIPKVDVEKMALDSDYYNVKGQETYQKGEYDSAVEYFYKAIEYNKFNAQAYNNLGMCYWQKNNLEFAIKYFKKANSVDRKFTQPFVNLAMLYKQLGNSKLQLFYLKKAIKLNDSCPLAYFQLGEYYKGRGCYAEAIRNYKSVVKLNPKYSQAYLSLAISYFEMKEYDYCLHALDQYNELCPESGFVFYLTARADLALAKYGNAKLNIEKAIEICDIPEYKIELGKIEYSMGDYQGALDIFQVLLQKNDSAELFNSVGQCYYKIKNMEAAIVNFNRAIALDGLKTLYYYNLAQCYKEIGDNNNYLKYYNTAVKIRPVVYQDFIDLSCIYFENGKTANAVELLNVAIGKYPSVRALYLEKLKVYDAIKDNLNYNKTKDLINKRFNGQ